MDATAIGRSLAERSRKAQGLAARIDDASLARRIGRLLRHANPQPQKKAS